MLTRRAFFYWQIIASFLLPSWVLVGRGIIDDGVGWDFVLYLVLCPILCVVMLAVAGLTVARKRVRTERAVSWQDVAVLGVWHAAIIAYGFVSSSVLVVVIVLIAAAAFWSAVWQLFAETRTRVQNAFSLDPVDPIDAGTYTAQKPRADVGPATGPDAGRVIIINPDGSRSETGDPR
jgi:hypothetical protein